MRSNERPSSPISSGGGPAERRLEVAGGHVGGRVAEATERTDQPAGHDEAEHGGARPQPRRDEHDGVVVSCCARPGPDPPGAGAEALALPAAMGFVDLRLDLRRSPGPRRPA